MKRFNLSEVLLLLICVNTLAGCFSQPGSNTASSIVPTATSTPTTSLYTGTATPVPTTTPNTTAPTSGSTVTLPVTTPESNFTFAYGGPYTLMQLKTVATYNYVAAANTLANITPTAPGGGVVLSNYSVSELPAGLSIASTTGIISGTPKYPTRLKTYTVYASGVVGGITRVYKSSPVTITVLVNPAVVVVLGEDD